MRQACRHEENILRERIAEESVVLLNLTNNTRYFSVISSNMLI